MRFRPAIHALLAVPPRKALIAQSRSRTGAGCRRQKKDVDGHGKRGHDEKNSAL
jgi:hypothetical protein